MTIGCLTFKELLELRLVDVMGDISYEQLVGVRVPDHPATLRLTLLALSDWKTNGGLGCNTVRSDPPSNTHTQTLLSYLVLGLCGPAGPPQASAPVASGPSVVSVLVSESLPSPPPSAETHNENTLQTLGVSDLKGEGSIYMSCLS